MAQVASGRGGPEPHPADSEPNGIRLSLHLPTGSLLGPQSADLLAVTPRSRSGRKKPGGWPGSHSLCPGPGKHGLATGAGGAGAGDMARPQQQSIVRAGSGNKGTLSWLPGRGLI